MLTVFMNPMHPISIFPSISQLTINCVLFLAGHRYCGKLMGVAKTLHIMNWIWTVVLSQRMNSHISYDEKAPGPCFFWTLWTYNFNLNTFKILRPSCQHHPGWRMKSSTCPADCQPPFPKQPIPWRGCPLWWYQLSSGCLLASHEVLITRGSPRSQWQMHLPKVPRKVCVQSIDDVWQTSRESKYNEWYQLNETVEQWWHHLISAYPVSTWKEHVKITTAKGTVPSK